MKLFLACLAAISIISVAQAADDPSIDKLISKLPPPEKFVDPAGNDPLAKQAITAFKQKNYGIALENSRRLASKFPKSFNAQLFHAQMAAIMRAFPESNVAFHKVLAIRPDFAMGYFGLGATEFGQQHYHAAMSDFQQVTRLLPNADIGWLTSSVCAERLGQQQLSLEYALHATTVAPKSAGAWYQVARAQGRVGNQKAASDALQKANHLRQSQPKKTTKQA